MKKLTSLLYTVVFALLISAISGITPFAVLPIMLIIGLVSSNYAPIGALNITVTSAFIGTNIANILSLLVLGAETIQKGLLHTIPSKYDKIYMPTLDTAADQLQNRVETPIVSAVSVYDERLIDPKDMMWYQEFNPATFEHVWSEFWPKGAMVNQIQDPKILAVIVKTINGSLNTQLDKLIWQGDEAGAAELAFFDGFLKIMLADADVVKVNYTGAIAADNIQEILNDAIKAMPAAVKVQKAAKFIMSHTTFEAFSEYTVGIDFKGTDIFEKTRMMYRGYELEAVGGMSDTEIVFCDASTSPDANLFAGTWLANDKDNFKIERLQANSELWFIKAIFRYGVQYGKGSEIVLVTPTP